MTPTLRITLEGSPERVQEIADVLDHAIPGTLEWHDFARFNGVGEIVLTGSSAPATLRAAPAGRLQ